MSRLRGYLEGCATGQALREKISGMPGKDDFNNFCFDIASFLFCLLHIYIHTYTHRRAVVMITIINL